MSAILVKFIKNLIIIKLLEFWQNAREIIPSFHSSPFEHPY